MISSPRPAGRRAEVGVVRLERLLDGRVRGDLGPLQELVLDVRDYPESVGHHVADLHEENRGERPRVAGHRARHELERDAGVELLAAFEVVGLVGVLVFIRGVARALADPGLVRDVGPGDGEQIRAERDDPEEDRVVPRDGPLELRLAPQTVEHAVRVVQDDGHVVEEPVLEVGRHEAGEQVPEQRVVRGLAVVVGGVLLAERLEVDGEDLCAKSTSDSGGPREPHLHAVE